MRLRFTGPVAHERAATAPRDVTRDDGSPAPRMPGDGSRRGLRAVPARPAASTTR
ncbi:hypothetical protein SUDANB15_01253 [Streptomyces sp. enrichment culture]